MQCAALEQYLLCIPSCNSSPNAFNVCKARNACTSQQASRSLQLQMRGSIRSGPYLMAHLSSHMHADVQDVAVIQLFQVHQQLHEPLGSRHVPQRPHEIDSALLHRGKGST